MLKSPIIDRPVGNIVSMAFVVAMMTYLLTPAAFAARLLETDDAGTLGKGVFQVEMGLEMSDHRQDQDNMVTKERTTSVSTAFSYGIHDDIDIIMEFPYERMRAREDGITIHNEKGFSDLALDAKWRFFEKENLAFALKPGLSFPTGNDKKGLGTGRMTYGMVFITTMELEPLAFHLNAGYRRNENKGGERKDIWAANLAGEVSVAKPLKLVANVGVETNKDRDSATAPVFFLGGLIYSVTDNIDIDLGYKRGLNKAESDNTYIGGITIKF